MITSVSDDLMYQEAGEGRDLTEEIQRAIRWCDHELTEMETKLPPVYAPE